MNIAGILQILHLQDRNTELAFHNSHLEAENSRLRADEPDIDAASATNGARRRSRGATPH